jgi:hypothetical protein
MVTISCYDYTPPEPCLLNHDYLFHWFCGGDPLGNGLVFSYSTIPGDARYAVDSSFMSVDHYTPSSSRLFFFPFTVFSYLGLSYYRARLALCGNPFHIHAQITSSPIFLRIIVTVHCRHLSVSSDLLYEIFSPFIVCEYRIFLPDIIA